MKQVEAENSAKERNKVLVYLSVLRPGQWVKNGFVWAPLLFSGQFNQWESFVITIKAFFSFCLISSTIYIINDLCDRREDRQHPVKRFRAIASGALRGREALLLSGAVMILSLFLGWQVNMRLLAIVIVYAIVNIAYSLGIKHVAILDVMVIYPVLKSIVILLRFILLKKTITNCNTYPNLHNNFCAH